MKSFFFLSLMNGAAWGGSEEIWYRTALWMCKNNYKVGVGCYAWEEKQDRINTLKEAGCRVYLLPNEKGLFNKRATKSVLNSIPFDAYSLTVINQGGWEEVLHAPFAGLYKKLPNYITCSHNYTENPVLSFHKQRLLKQWLDAARMNFGATLKIFEMIEKNFHFCIGKKATLINPVTFKTEDLPAPYPPLTHEPCTWIMLAELDIARKAQDILIRALASTTWKARNWQLHIYGRGKDKVMLEKLISASGLEDKIFLKGFTENIKEALQHSHLLLQCTRIDAMPLSVVEAMAMARPCVVSNVGDMPDWVEDGISGFVCNDITEKGVEDTMERCWQQKDKWAMMGNKAFGVFIKKYPQPYESTVADILSRYAS